jgi:alcohol dehydrogenase
VTIVGVISDSDTHKKFGVVISGATLAIVDPELTLGLPAYTTATTGMDVVAHAVEAITGKMRNPMSDLRGYEALRLVNAHLLDAVLDGSNIVARSGMSLASSLAGLAFSDSITSLGHATAQGIASVYPLHHGLLCGLATPPQLEAFATAVPERVRKIGEIFGADIPYDATNEEIGKIAADKVRVFMSQLGIQSFEQMGYTRKQIVDLKDILMAEMMKDFSPCPITDDVAYKVLDSMYDYKGAK